MIKKHEINTAIGHPALTDLEGFLSEALSVTDQIVALLGAIEEFEQSGDDDDFLDAIDTASVMYLNGLRIFEQCRLSVCPAINKYLARTILTFDELMKLLDTYSTAAMTPVDDNGADGLQTFKELTKKVVAGMTYFICYEFGLFEFVDNYTDGEEDVDIDEVYHLVTSKSSRINAGEKAAELCALALKYKQRLDIFDEYPEKEQEFERVMGPFAVELSEGSLTVELIDQVIHGDLTPQELLAIVNPTTDDDALYTMRSF